MGILTSLLLNTEQKQLFHSIPNMLLHISGRLNGQNLTIINEKKNELDIKITEVNANKKQNDSSTR